MKAFIQFESSGDVLDCPEITREELFKKRWDEFLLWIFNEKNDHPYWIYKEGEKIGCSFRADAFEYWLNHQTGIPGLGRAKVLRMQVDRPEEKMLVLML